MGVSQCVCSTQSADCLSAWVTAGFRLADFDRVRTLLAGVFAGAGASGALLKGLTDQSSRLADSYSLTDARNVGGKVLLLTSLPTLIQMMLPTVTLGGRVCLQTSI